jgi:RNA polymerase-binding transcription factor DksA
MIPNQQKQIRQRCSAQLQVERDAAMARLEGKLGTEISSASFDLNTQLFFKQQLAKKLKRIEKAVEREQDGEYGHCIRCGAPMWDRLLILPYAENCTDCQTQLERRTVSGYQIKKQPKGNQIKGEMK